MFSHSTNRRARKQSCAPFVASALVAAVLAFSAPALRAQSSTSASANKSQAGSNAGTPAQPNSASAASTSPAQPKAGGMVWVNTQTGTYHKQGTRWYGKTRQGKYMLEADALKAGYKPAK